MAGYQDILSKYIDVANAPIDKASEVLAASNEKKQAMGYREAAQTDVNLGRPQTAEELISEVTDVNGIIARAAGASRFGDDSTARRSNGEVVSDSIKGAALGLGGSLLNIANMGVGVVSDDAGANMANWISQKISDRQAEQSDGLNAHRRAYAARSEITQEENARKYNLERQTDGNMVAGFKRIGRDFLDAASKTIDDPTLLADTAANGVGSLLAGGGIGKGLTALKFGAAAMPVAIGLLEGGGAYQQTTKEALDRGASNEDANRAGLIAAAIQGPIGAGTGILTSKFEANPLSVAKVRNAFSNVLKEGVEEGIQSGSGQAAQNFALSQKVTPDQDLLAGVGEQAGIGAVGGLGTAGILQAPGAVIQTGVNAAKAVGSIGSAAYNAVLDRGDSLVADAANASPSSAVNIQTNIATTMAVAPEIQEQIAAIVTSEKAPVVSAALDNLFQKAAFDPSEADTQPPVVAEAIRESTDRFDAMSRAAAIASDTKLDPADRIAAGQYINDTMSNPDLEVLDIDLDELLASEANNPAVAQVQKFKDAIENIQNNPEIIQARTAAQQLAADITPEQVSDVSTPQGQVLTHAVASLAQEAPESTNPEVLKAVLLHADNGSVAFTPEETEALQAAQAIHTIAAETQASAEREGFTVKNVMTTPIQDIASDVSNDIRANTSKDAYAPSASTYLKEIARAVKTGNPEVAREKLQEIMLFAKHMQGKVNALNENLKQGNWSKDNKTSYDVLTVATRKFIPAGGSLNIIPGSVGSVKFARRVNLDAQSVVSMANALATTYPKLGIKPIQFAPLDATITEGDVKDVVRSYRPNQVQSAGIPVENTQAPVETTPAVKPVKVAREESPDQIELPLAEPVEKPIEKAPEAVTPTKVETPEAVTTVQTEGGDQVATTEVVEPQKEPTPQTGGSTDETVEKSDTVAPDKEATPKAEAEKTVTDPVDQVKTPKLKPMEVTYPNLVENKEKGVINYFRKAFKLPTEARSRMIGESRNPVVLVHDLIGSKAKLEDFVGTDRLENRLTAKVTEAYRTAIRIVGEKTQESLDARLTEALGNKFYDKTIKDGLLDGSGDKTAVNRLTRYRLLNLLEETENGLALNDELIGGAVLAGIQWLLSSSAKTSEMDEEQIAKFLKISERDVTSTMVKEFNKGMPLSEVENALAEQIVRFWGLEREKNAPMGHTHGIPLAVAIEVIRGLEAAGLLATRTVKYDEKTYGQVIRTDDKNAKAILREMAAFPDLLSYIVLTEPERVNYIGSPETKIPETQMRNPRAKNTPKDMEEIQNENNIAYNLTIGGFTSLLEEIGPQASVRLFGYDTTDEKLNVEHKNSLDGFNRMIFSAHEGLEDLLANVRNYSDTVDQKVEDVKIYFAHNKSRVGRTQQIGSATPQGNKVIREALSSTFTTVDLSDKKNRDYGRFMLAIAQHLGKKVELLGRSKAVEQAEEAIQNDYPKTVAILQDWVSRQKHTNSRVLTKEDIFTFREEFGGPVSAGAFSALLEYARYKSLSVQDRKTFKTPVYLELDGKTDGPGNALIHMVGGEFTPRWIKMAAKVGLLLGSSVKTLAQQYDPTRPNADTKDLYEEGSDATHRSSKFDLLWNQNAENTQPWYDFINQSEALYHMIGRTIKGASFNDRGSVDYDRRIAKNPMTVTIYGSGPMGIANKLTTEMVKSIYEKLSTDSLTKEDKFNIEQIATKFIRKNRDGGTTLKDFGDKLDFSDPVNFKFTSQQKKNIQQNLAVMFVENLTDGINETIGDVNPGKEVVRKAVQVQSIFLQYAYRLEVEKAMKQKAKDPTWSASDFLSLRELEAIETKLIHLSPFIETDTQNFYVAGSEKSDMRGPVNQKTGKRSDGPQFARGLDDKLGTTAQIPGPVDVGVSGIPTIVIGSGDGRMMQGYMTGENAPKNGLRVFDGTNVPLDQIEAESRKVNEAVFSGWFTSNPMQAVSDAFSSFMEAVEVNHEYMAKDQIEALQRALMEDYDEGTPPKPAQFKNRMQQIDADLKRMSLEIQARKNVLTKVKMSIDHMASAESPYEHDGSIELTGSETDMANQLNKLLHDEMNRLTGKPVISENIEEVLSDLGTKDANTGLRSITMAEFRQNFSKLNIPEDQKIILKNILKTRVADEYTVVFGPTEEVQNAHGFISIGSKKIHLINPSSETLVHEIIHAATFEKVWAAYNDPISLSKVEKEAVARIEVMMHEWLSTETSNAAKTAIREYLAKDNVPAAVNEFMAWNLSNQNLIEETKALVLKNPLARMIEAVIASIKELIWGAAKAPEVGNDLYSNLRFNTAILINKAPTMQERLNNTVLFQSNNQRLNELDQKFAAKLALLIQKDPVAGQLKVKRNIPKVSDVTDSFNAHGFNMTMQEKGVFSTILNVMMTEAYLNPNALTRIQEIYDHAIKNLTVESFMPAVSRDPSVDRYYAQEKFNTIIGNYITEYDEQGRSTLLPSFVALAAVNDNFRKVLSEIGLPKSIKSTEKTLDAWLENKAIEALDYTSTALSGEGRGRENAKQALDALTANLADTLEDRELYVEQFVTPVGNAIDKGNGILRDGMARLAQKGIDIIDKRDAKATNKVEKATLGLARIFVSMANEDRADEVSKGTIAMVNRWNMPAFIKEVMVELVGRNSENASVTDMAKHVRAEVQKLRQQFREDVPKIIQGKFSRKLTDQEWSDLTKGLGRTDIGALKNGMTVAQIVALLNNDTKLEAKILDMEEDLSSIQPDNWPTIQKKAKQLAQFMLSGDWSVFEGNALKNAYAIAMMMGEQSKGVINANDATVQAIDQLVSLYAVQALDADTKSTISSLAQEEAEGMEFATNYLIGRRISELQKVENSGLARANHYKGHVPTENQSGTSLVVASNSEYGRLRTLGFKPVGVYTGSRSEQNPGLSYFFAPLSGRAMFSQGIIQNVRNTASGVDPRTGFSMGVMTAGRITDPRLVKQIKQRIGSNKNTTEPLAPIYDEAGSLVAYERTLDPNQVARLEQNNNLSTILGQWIGRQVEEAKASAINESLIDELGKMWTDPARDKIDYVNLFDQKKLTPVQKDAVKLLTPETRQYAESVFGKDEFWVRKDLINQVTGYRSASVGDVWTGTTNISEPIRKEAARIITGIFGIDAYRKLVTAEKLYQNFIADARATIVVKSVIVPVANGISGIYQLVGRGVPIVDIAKGYPRKLMEANAYIKNRHREIVLMAELEAVGDNFNKERKIRAEIQAIQDGYKRLSIYPILHELSSITDAGISHETTLMVEGKLSAAVERWVDKLPKDIKTAGRYAIISKDTALFKGLQRAVQYGDFLAKAVLYDDLVKRQGKSKEYALGRIMDEFVNYDLLAGRSRSYMESMGLMWFWHFKLRSVKIALSTFRNNPLHMLLAGLAPQPEMFGSIGMPLTDNAISVLGDGRFEYSVGPGMGLNAHQMNPYWNAMF